MSEFGGIEVWRGGVNTWECDALGHMNVRFYVARAVEGLVGLASALGLNGAFRERTNATLLVRDHHIRFLREAKAGTPLHMVGGVLDIQECEARFLQLLIHSTTGQLAASFQTRVTHATAGDERAFPWSEVTRLSAARLKIMVPDEAVPRSLGLAFSAGQGTLVAADALGLAQLGTGAISVSDCDVFGRMRPDVLVGRISDGNSGLGGVLPTGSAEDEERSTATGSAVLEYRLAYLAWPRAGDRYVIRSGLAAVSEKTRNFVHWMLDPETGGMWGSSEAIAISLDLAARRIVPLSPADQAFLRARITPGLVFSRLGSDRRVDGPDQRPLDDVWTLHRQKVGCSWHSGRLDTNRNSLKAFAQLERRARFGLEYVDRASGALQSAPGSMLLGYVA